MKSKTTIYSLYSEKYYPSIGGMETAANLFIRGMLDIGCNVRLGTLSEGDFYDGDKEYKINRLRCLRERLFFILTSDVIVLNGLTVFECISVVILRKKFIIIHHHAYNLPDGNLSFTSKIKIKVSQLIGGVCVSNFLSKKIGGNMTTINNAYDDKNFYINSSINRKKNDFVYCGRLVFEKGLYELIYAFEVLVKTYPECRLHIIGDGEIRCELEYKFAQLIFSGALIFHGALQKTLVNEVFNRCGALVMPSICEETFGIVVLEAMAAGCEVIASVRGGIPEACGGFGYMCEPNSSDILVAMIKYLNAENCNNEKEKAYFLKKHTPKSLAESYIRYINSRYVP